eukprot:9207_1
MPTSLRGDSYHEYFSQKYSNQSYSAHNNKYDSVQTYLCIMIKLLIITVLIDLFTRNIFMTIISIDVNFYANYHIWIVSIIIGVCIPQSLI